MKRYRVVFTEDAVAELTSSLQWGLETWGEQAAWQWYTDMKEAIRMLLESFPLSQPISPDAGDYEVEVWQMIVDRYRVLFNVHGKTVTILHVRGPYTG